MSSVSKQILQTSDCYPSKNNFIWLLCNTKFITFIAKQPFRTRCIWPGVVWSRAACDFFKGKNMQTTFVTRNSFSTFFADNMLFFSILDGSGLWDSGQCGFFLEVSTPLCRVTDLLWILWRALHISRLALQVVNCMYFKGSPAGTSAVIGDDAADDPLGFMRRDLQEWATSEDGWILIDPTAQEGTQWP